MRDKDKAKLAVQALIHAGKLELAWSYILDLENAANPFPERLERIATWKALAVIDISESADVLDSANAFLGFGLRSKDCLHLACAIQAKCSVFLTTDDGILKKSENLSEIRVLNPVSHITDSSK